MDAVTIATFNEREPAEPVVKRLESAGIHTQIHDESKLQKAYFLSDNYASIRVRVDPKDFERAKSLLEKWNKEEGLLRDALQCPQCGASRVQYPQFTRQFFIPSFFIGLGMALGIVKKEFFCRECQYTWPKQIELEANRDALGWPAKETNPERASNGRTTAR